MVTGKSRISNSWRLWPAIAWRSASNVCDAFAQIGKGSRCGFHRITRAPDSLDGSFKHIHPFRCGVTIVRHADSQWPFFSESAEKAGFRTAFLRSEHVKNLAISIA